MDKLGIIEGKLVYEKKSDVVAFLSIRNTLYRDQEVQKFGIQQSYSHSRKQKFGSIAFNALGGCWSFIRFLFSTHQSENIVLIYGTNLSRRDGKRDAVCDYFTEKKEDFVSISLGKNKLNANFTLFTMVFICKIIGAAFAKTVLKFKTTEVDRLLQELSISSPSINITVPKDFLYRKYLDAILLGNVCSWILKLKIKPGSTIFLEEGHYQDNCVLIYWLKKNGFKISELQHGMIHKRHEAYNFPNVKFDWYKPFLPDRFYTFGTAWSELISIPAAVESIGWYKLSRKVYRNNLNPNAVLFIGTGLDTSKTVSLFKNFKLRYSEYTFLFRPHPLERELCRSILLKDEIDERPLEDSLMASVRVVGEVSTVLFEAKHYGCKVMGLKNCYVKGTGLEKMIPFVDVQDIDAWDKFFK